MRNCPKRHTTTPTAMGAILFLLVLVIVLGTAYAKPAQSEDALPPAYNLGCWMAGPVALGLLLCVVALGLGFARRRKEAPQPLTNSSSATHLRWLLLTLFAFYLGCILSGLAAEFGANGFTTTAVMAHQDEARNIASERVFGRFRAPLREGSFSTLLSVAAIVCFLNTFSAVTQHFVSGLMLVPGVALLGYVGWQQGTTLATCGASTFGSMLGFLWLLGLESFTYVLDAAAGIHVTLALVSPAWVGASTRKAALRTALVTALKFFGVIVAILIFQALCEAFYVRQVLLHGGSGVPLMPY